MRANPGSYRTHALANQGEAGIGLLVGLAVIAVGGIAYLVLRPAPAPASSASPAAPAPAVSPSATTPPPAPPALNPASNMTTLTPTKQPPSPQQNYSGHHGLHGLQWLA